MPSIEDIENAPKESLPETIDFGAPIKEASDYIKEMYELVGEEFPVNVVVLGGVLKNVSIQPEWQEGGTIAIEEEINVEKIVEIEDVRDVDIEAPMADENGKAIILPDGSAAKEIVTIQEPFIREEKIMVKEMQVTGYEQNYVDKKLSKEQVAALKEYMQENLVP